MAAAKMNAAQIAAIEELERQAQRRMRRERSPIKGAVGSTAQAIGEIAESAYLAAQLLSVELGKELARSRASQLQDLLDELS